MNIRERWRDAVRRVGEGSWRGLLSEGLVGGGGHQRRPVGPGSSLTPALSSGSVLPVNISRVGAPTPHSLVMKPTPANLRRFSEMPVARRAINVIKDRISGMRWRIQARRGRALGTVPGGGFRGPMVSEHFVGRRAG